VYAEKGEWLHTDSAPPTPFQPRIRGGTYEDAGRGPSRNPGVLPFLSQPEGS